MNKIKKRLLLLVVVLIFRFPILPVYAAVDQPPTISSGVSCSQVGTYGWCIGTSTLNLSASDPQGYTLTISGDIDGTSFTCATGTTCSQNLPEGNGKINYSVTASESGLSAVGATTWKRDITSPTVNPIIPSPDGFNNWFKTAPTISVSGSDVLSGYAYGLISDNGSDWRFNNISITSDGIHSLIFQVSDMAGNIATTTRTVSVDKTLPQIAVWGWYGKNGSNGWWKNLVLSGVACYDATSGVDSCLVSDNGGPGQPTDPMKDTMTLDDGLHAIVWTVTDKSGLSWSSSQNFKVDGTPPVIAPSISGTAGWNDWYTSSVDMTVSGTDATSGLASTDLSLDGEDTWQSSASLASDGVYPIHLRASDNAGNYDTMIYTVSIDTTPPSVSLDVKGTLGANDWYISPVDITANTNDATSGIASVTYRLDGGTWQPGTTTRVSNGAHTVDFLTTDNAGNTASSSMSVKVDTVNPLPSLTISGRSGINDWYTSSVSLTASGTDATSGLAYSALSVNGGSSSASAALADGVYSVVIASADNAGNIASTTQTVRVDTVPPTLTLAISGTPGSNGWYTSTVTISPNASDALSGVDYAEIRANEGTWSPQQILSDGVHNLKARVGDVAGNTQSISGIWRVDTKSPISSFDDKHKSNDMISGIVKLGGQSSDPISGVQLVQVSTDGGATWNTASLLGGTWSYDWNSALTSNGSYTVLVRAEDAAGNLEDPTSSIILVVDNPPSVKITDWWWIWESGEYRVSANSFPISSINVKISDPENRWDSLMIDYDPNMMSAPIKWDRRFPGEIIAPSGNYTVTVTACDTYGKCASAQGQIKIPFFAFVPPTSTSLPAVIPTVFVTPTASLVPTASTTPIPATTPTVVGPLMQAVSATKIPGQFILPQTEPSKQENYRGIFQLLWIVVFLSLLIIFGTSVVLDHRPEAIRALAQTIQNNMK